MKSSTLSFIATVWLSSTGAMAATTGEFTVLTMNVAGLPAILQGNDVPGDKATNAATLGSLFGKYKYDVIHAQEDFNYHAKIYAADNHPYRTATSGGVPFGDGLNTLSNYPWVNYERVKWATCSDASSNDCLTPKGFTFMRLAPSGNTSSSQAVFADFYNLHADAGTEPGDLTARTANLRQVADQIAVRSAGNAVVVFGDTNSRYSRTGDVGLRDLLASAGSGLTDVWVQVERDGVVPTVESLCNNPSNSSYCETVDKVFYRTSPLVNISATAFAYVSNKFLQADGSILSDHNPILANFTWQTTSLQQSGFWGGPHGTWFSDATVLASKPQPKAATISFRGSARLDGLSVTLADGTVLSHGGTGGTAATLSLGPTEYWTAARLCQGQKSGQTRIFYLRATTSAGRTLASGTATSDCVDFSVPAGWQIVGSLGQAGDELDQLGFLYAPALA